MALGKDMQGVGNGERGEKEPSAGKTHKVSFLSSLSFEKGLSKPDDILNREASCPWIVNNIVRVQGEVKWKSLLRIVVTPPAPGVCGSSHNNKILGALVILLLFASMV